MSTVTPTVSTEPPHSIKHLLASFTSTHPLRSPSPLPPSSRVNPKIIQRTPPKSSNPFFWTIPTWIAFVKFACFKVFHILWSLFKHVVVGPQRKSWGYRMTFIASFMRNVADHTSLADIILIRRLVSLHFLVPLPADAVVTPITFVVPKHLGDQVARGFLRSLDLLETGIRELSGEWVVGTDVWQRLKSERRARNRRPKPRTSSGEGGTPRQVQGLRESATDTASGSSGRDSPDTDNASETSGMGEKGDKERVIYYVHGGAYYVGNAATHRLITIGVSKACNARVFAITYRLAPEHAFPLPLHDVLLGYLRLLAPPLSISPANIIIAGDSAGGGLSLALCMYLRDEGYQLPAGLVLMSPWVDLSMSCGSWEDCAKYDVVPRPQADDHLNPVACYLGPQGISQYLTHPYASPLFGNLHNLPPMLIQSGDSEVLRDEITLLAHKATLTGNAVTHELYEDMVHVFQMFTFLPAAQTAISSIGRWVRQTLPRIEAERARQQTAAAAIPNETLDNVDREMATQPQIVGEDGQPLTGPRPGVTAAEVQALNDQHQREETLGGSLQLDVRPPHLDQPTIDRDSLPSPASRSGSPTPTASPGTASAQDDAHRSNRRANAPQLRRALTEISTATLTTNTPLHSPPAESSSSTVRRRRPTQGAASLHVSPAASRGSGPSNPVSPTPSVRMRLRSPTMTALNGPGQGRPRGRDRSQSHSDILELVQGYLQEGAANETVVYAPGGEVRSVGVLGGDGSP